MLGDFITRCLVLLLGYAYPAFECFKSIEKNKIDIEELRFWCQYWIIVAMLTVCERIGDTFVSWLPMYGEIKLGFFIYLWYPKTKGCGYVYEALLRPIVAKHETDIDRKLQELRARAWDLAIYYWQNCTQLGQTKFFEILQFLANQSTRITNTKSEKADNRYPPAESPTFKHQSKNKKWPSPSAPPMPGGTINHSVTELPKSNVVQVQLNSQTEYVQTLDTSTPEQDSGTVSTSSSINDKLQQARLKLRRSKPTN